MAPALGNQGWLLPASPTFSYGDDDDPNENEKETKAGILQGFRRALRTLRGAGRDEATGRKKLRLCKGSASSRAPCDSYGYLGTSVGGLEGRYGSLHRDREVPFRVEGGGDERKWYFMSNGSQLQLESDIKEEMKEVEEAELTREARAKRERFEINQNFGRRNSRKEARGEEEEEEEKKEEEEVAREEEEDRVASLRPHAEDPTHSAGGGGGGGGRRSVASTSSSFSSSFGRRSASRSEQVIGGYSHSVSSLSRRPSSSASSSAGSASNPNWILLPAGSWKGSDEEDESAGVRVKRGGGEEGGNGEGREAAVFGIREGDEEEPSPWKNKRALQPRNRRRSSDLAPVRPGGRGGVGGDLRADRRRLDSAASQFSVYRPSTMRGIREREKRELGVDVQEL